ncbi:hypothetical protein BC941DRAFT_356769, partial [Chlamydoabsidia padenii]
GLTAAIQLQKQFGIRARVFEYNSDVGGTWFSNTYPGCACDVPSALYSFSFEQRPDWTQNYSSQSEIFAYFREVAKKYGIYDQTYFNTKVVQLTWMESSKTWKVDYCRDKSTQIQSESFDIVLGGIGSLRVTNIPDEYMGFKGKIMHTAIWDSAFDFTDKRVAIIGAGASAVQVIPELQKVAKHIYSYQRTPAWVLDRYQYKQPSWLITLLQWFPFLMILQRFFVYLIYESCFLYLKNRDSYLTKTMQRLLARRMTRRLQKVGRGDLAPLLVPKYNLGCKRLTWSETYLESLAKDNATVKLGTIKQVDGNTIVHEDGSSIDVDVLVLATGFDSHGFLGELKVNGRHGQELNHMWSGNNYPDTYKSITVNGFPNFFLFYGPNSSLGIMIMVENQVNYVMQCMKYMSRNMVKAIEPKKVAQSQYVANLTKEMASTTWASNSCQSYYKRGGRVT